MSPKVEAVETRTSPSAHSFAQIAEDGIFSGMIGALSVAVWFLILDLIAGRPLYTPSLLGKVLFLGSQAIEDTAIDPTMVVVYTGLHMVVFMSFGMVAAYMVSASERFPAMGILFLFLFVIFEAIFFIYSLAFGGELIGTLGLWAVIVANLLAAGGMSYYFIRRHPLVLKSLQKSFEDS